MADVTGNRRKLYNAASARFTDIGTWDEFNSKMNDEGNRRKFYDAMKSQFSDIGTWDDFNSKVYEAPKPAPKQQTTPQSQQQQTQAAQRPVSPAQPAQPVSQVQPQVAQTETTAPIEQPTPPPAPAEPKFKLDNVVTIGGVQYRVDGFNEDGTVKVFNYKKVKAENIGVDKLNGGTLYSEESWKPTQQQRVGMQMQLNAVKAQTEAKTKQIKEQTENMVQYSKDPRSMNFQTVEGGLQINPATGKMEMSYLTPGGQRTFNKAAADRYTQQLRVQIGAQRRAEIIAQNPGYADLEARLQANGKKLRAYYDERARKFDSDRDPHKKEGESWWDAFVRSFGSTVNEGTNRMHPHPTGRDAGIPVSADDPQEKIKALLAENIQLTQAMRKMEMATKHKERKGFWGGVQNFGEGFLDGVVDVFTAPVTDLSVAGELNKAKKDATVIRDGKEVIDPSRLTDAQLQLLISSSMGNAAEQNADVGSAYTWGQFTPELLATIFMWENSAFNGLTRQVSTQAAKQTAKYFIKEMAGKTAAKWASRAAGATAFTAAGLTEAAGFTWMYKMPETMADAYNRETGAPIIGLGDYKDGNYALTIDGFTPGSEHPWLKAGTAGTLSNYGLLLAGVYGKILDPAGKWVSEAMGKAISKGVSYGSKDAAVWIDNVALPELRQISQSLAQHTGKKWSSPVALSAGMTTGEAMNAITVGDFTLDTDPEHGVFNLDRRLDDLATCAIMDAGMAAVKMPSYRTARQRAKADLNLAAQRAAAAFGENPRAWETIRNMVLGGNMNPLEWRDMHRTIRGGMDGKEYALNDAATWEAMEEFFNAYGGNDKAKAVLVRLFQSNAKIEGQPLSEDLRTRIRDLFASDASENAKEAIRSVLDGDIENMATKLRSMTDEQRALFTEILNSDASAEQKRLFKDIVDADVTDENSELLRNILGKEFTPEQKEAVLNYYRSLNTYYGMKRLTARMQAEGFNAEPETNEQRLLGSGEEPTYTEEEETPEEFRTHKELDKAYNQGMQVNDAESRRNVELNRNFREQRMREAFNIPEDVAISDWLAEQTGKETRNAQWNAIEDIMSPSECEVIRNYLEAEEMSDGMNDALYDQG